MSSAGRRLVRRLWRWLEASRIRVPRRGLDPAGLRRGDWVQLGSEAWRVGTRLVVPQGRLFLLEPRERGTRPARLLAPRGEEPWRLGRDDEEPELDLDPAELVVYAAGSLEDASGQQEGH